MHVAISYYFSLIDSHEDWLDKICNVSFKIGCIIMHYMHQKHFYMHQDVLLSNIKEGDHRFNVSNQF